jgi:hypothetical protein
LTRGVALLAQVNIDASTKSFCILTPMSKNILTVFLLCQRFQTMTTTQACHLSSCGTWLEMRYAAQ